MNRRDILKALAGIPLLGLLVKVPKVAEQPPTWTMIGPGIGAVEIDEASLTFVEDPESEWHTMTYEGNRLIHDDGEPDYCYVGDKEPYLSNGSNIRYLKIGDLGYIPLHSDP